MAERGIIDISDFKTPDLKNDYGNLYKKGYVGSLCSPKEDDKLREAIYYLYMLQHKDNLANFNSSIFGNQNVPEEIEKISQAFNDGKDGLNIAINVVYSSGSFIPSKHSLLPYRIVDTEEEKRIYCYDSNTPCLPTIITYNKTNKKVKLDNEDNAVEYGSVRKIGFDYISEIAKSYSSYYSNSTKMFNLSNAIVNTDAEKKSNCLLLWIRTLK